MNPSFATTLASVKNKNPGRQVLTMLNKHGAIGEEAVRRYLLDAPDVPPPVRKIASLPGQWKSYSQKSAAWRDPDSLPGRRLELCRAIVVRVLRSPDSIHDADRAKAKTMARKHGGRVEDYMPVRPVGWDGGVMFTRLRMLTALVGLHQLRSLNTPPHHARPWTNLRNFALMLNVAIDGKSVRDRLASATSARLLEMDTEPEKGKSGVWLVRPFLKAEERAEPLTRAEEAIAQAMFQADESDFAAALLLNADHIGFHYEPDGLAAWWLLLRVAADPFFPVLSNLEERFIAEVRSMADVEARVSDEARADRASKGTTREVQKQERNASREAHDAVVHSGWNNVHQYLRWDSLPSREESLEDSEEVRRRISSWTDGALGTLRRVPPDKRHRVDGVLSVLRTALPKRLPAHGERVFSYLKEGLRND